MAITLRAVGTSTAAAGAVTGVTAGAPAGLTATDISILTVEIKGSSTTAPTITTPTGWTLIGTVTNNGTSAGGTDTGSNTIGMYYQVGNTYSAPTITTTNASSMGAGIVAYQTSTGAIWDVSGTTTGSDTTSGANGSITGAANLNLASGDLVIVGAGLSGDIGSITAETLAATGATVGTRGDRFDLAVTTGNDSRLVVVDWPITAGPSSAAPIFTYTNASNTTSHARFVRLRETTFNTVTYQANGVTVLANPDAALTAPSSLTDGSASVVKVDPYAGAEYDPNKVWSQAASGIARPTLADAIADDIYTYWTVSRTGGLLPKQIRIKVARGALGTAVRGFRIRWDVDGYASDLLGRDTALTSAETRPNLVQHPVSGDPLQGDLSGAAQQNSVTFRIYNYATSAVNTLEFDDLEFTYDPVVSTGVTGTGNLTAAAPTLAGAGTLTITGTGALAPTGGAIVGAGTLRITGTGALTAPSPTLAGSGTVRVTGAGGLTAGTPTLAGSGTLRLTGSGALSAASPTLTAAGTLTVTGTGALTASSPTLAGSDTNVVTGTGALTAASPTLSGAGTLRISGSGALTAAAPSLTAAGVIRIIGAGAITAATPALSGSGTLRITGTGALTAGTPTLAGSGVLSIPGGPGDVVTHTYGQATLVGSQATATLAKIWPGTATLTPTPVATATLHTT